MTERTTPTFPQYVGYLFGRPLPRSMQDWVLRDVTGPGSTMRYLVRFVVPATLLLLLFLLIPGPIWVPLAMIALLVVPLAYFAIALMTIYRRHRLQQHGLDPDLVGERERRRRDAVRNDYERRHGRID
ncbi:hypothetical protein DW322_04145 [Rhodococcus rhodnii]|nr:DUF5313 family protein [Rhodococcus rhodnii]TXG92389.1 hypothetical protein DW322_04145 [Rhodococcus rhodnii]